MRATARRRWRPSHVLGAICMVAAGAARPPGNALPSPVGPAPGNVLILLLDDVGVEMIRGYGENPAAANTPQIDSLIQKGVLFRNAYSAPVCSPTRAALQTGRYGFRTGIGYLVDATKALSLDETTLPEMLDLGTGGLYEHAAFGKWHLGNDSVGGDLAPNLAGYGHYAGHLSNLGSGGYFSWEKITDGVKTDELGYVTTDTIDDALAWIHGRRGPWLAYVAFHAPHAPFHVPPQALHTLDVTERSSDTLKYKAAIEALDTEIGRLARDLKRTGAFENTTILLLGDNGAPGQTVEAPYLATHAKHTLYEGGINVPFVVVSPYVKHPGSESDAFVNAVDVFATVAGVAQVDLAAVMPGVKLDSISVLPYLQAPKRRSIRPYCFSEKFTSGGALPDEGVVIRNSRYKLYDSTAGPGLDRFFDLEADPFELNNLLFGGVGLIPGSEEDLNRQALQAALAQLLSS